MNDNPNADSVPWWDRAIPPEARAAAVRLGWTVVAIVLGAVTTHLVQADASGQTIGSMGLLTAVVNALLLFVRGRAGALPEATMVDAEE